MCWWIRLKQKVETSGGFNLSSWNRGRSEEVESSPKLAGTPPPPKLLLLQYEPQPSMSMYHCTIVPCILVPINMVVFTRPIAPVLFFGWGHCQVQHLQWLHGFSWLSWKNIGKSDITVTTFRGSGSPHTTQNCLVSAWSIGKYCIPNLKDANQFFICS